MPPRNTTAEVISRAADRCLKIACERHFSTVPIGEVSTVMSGGTPSTGNPAYWDGDIVWVTPKDLGRPRNIEIGASERRITQAGCNNSSAKILPIGTVLLSSRAPIGHLGISSVPLCTNQGFKNIICSDNLNNRFLFHMLRASIDELQSAGRGNTFAEIPARIVNDHVTPMPPLDTQNAVASFLDTLYHRLAGERSELPSLPPPLSDQRRIVARIEELAAKIDEACGLRQKAVRGLGTLIGTKISDLFSKGASNGWVAGRLGDYVIDDCYGTSEKTTDDESGTPILRMGNIQNGRLDLRDLKYLHLSEKDRERLLLIKDDILVNRTNSAELVGKCAVFDRGEEYSFASYLIRLRLDTKRADPSLVASYINSPQGRAYMFSERKQMTGQANVNAAKLKALPISLPSLLEQRRIVAYLDDLREKVDALKRLQAETATELDAMLPSILDKAFRGDLS